MDYILILFNSITTSYSLCFQVLVLRIHVITQVHVLWWHMDMCVNALLDTLVIDVKKVYVF